MVRLPSGRGVSGLTRTRTTSARKGTLGARISYVAVGWRGVRRGQCRVHAGLVPLLELAEQAGPSRLLDEHVRFVDERVKSRAANSTLKLTSIIGGMPPGQTVPMRQRRHPPHPPDQRARPVGSTSTPTRPAPAHALSPRRRLVHPPVPSFGYGVTTLRWAGGSQRGVSSPGRSGVAGPVVRCRVTPALVAWMSRWVPRSVTAVMVAGTTLSP